MHIQENPGYSEYPIKNVIEMVVGVQGVFIQI